MRGKINDRDLDYVTETLLKAIVEDKVVMILGALRLIDTIAMNPQNCDCTIDVYLLRRAMLQIAMANPTYRRHFVIC